MFSWCEWGIIISNYYSDEHFKTYSNDIIFIILLFWGGGREGGGQVGVNRGSDQCIFCIASLCMWVYMFIKFSLFIFKAASQTKWKNLSHRIQSA